MGRLNFSLNGLAFMSFLLLLMVTYCSLPALASSTVIDGPGFQVSKKAGWFGRKQTTYQDALGNGVQKQTGLFGRTKTRTRVFGSEVDQKGKNIMVSGPNGQPLISKKKTLLHGEETHIDGNNIIQSVQSIFK